MSFQTGPAHEPTARPTPRPVELFATLGLAVSTLIAVTAVSIGIARADTLTAHADSGIAALIGFLF